MARAMVSEDPGGVIRGDPEARSAEAARTSGVEEPSRLGRWKVGRIAYAHAELARDTTMERHSSLAKKQANQVVALRGEFAPPLGTRLPAPDCRAPGVLGSLGHEPQHELLSGLTSPCSATVCSSEPPILVESLVGGIAPR
tara:strand:+ start:2424 stop:2846 length:423 start_codon:yes stop_codon:yes gene_type:complete